MKGKSESAVAELCLTLRDPMDCSAPGSSFHGIFQARVLEWGAIAFSSACIFVYINESPSMYLKLTRRKSMACCAQSVSHVPLSVIPWTVAC